MNDELSLAEKYERACNDEREAEREFDEACGRALVADQRGDATALAAATDDAEYWQAELDEAREAVRAAEEAIAFYR